MYSFSFYFSTTSFSRRKRCWTRWRSGHRSTRTLTLSGSGVSQPTWLSPTPPMPRFCWPEEVRRWCLQLRSNNRSLKISHTSLKIQSKAGFHKEVVLQKSSEGMERYPSFMPCPWCFRHRAAGVMGTPPNLANQTPSSIPWKVIFSVPDPSKEKTAGSFFLSSDPWFLLQSHIFSAEREVLNCAAGEVNRLSHSTDFELPIFLFIPAWASAFRCVSRSWAKQCSFVVKYCWILQGCHRFCFIPNQKWEPRGTFKVQTSRLVLVKH